MEPQDSGPYKLPLRLDGVPVSGRFVARPADTAYLEKILLPRPSRPRHERKVLVVHGLGGLGKTQLVIDFARRHAATFSAIFWLDGRSEDRLRQSIAGCVRRIPEHQIPDVARFQAEALSKEDLDAAVARMMEWLARSDNTDWLLIFDNVDQDHEQGGSTGAYDLKAYLPANHGSVLVTSRLSHLSQLGEPCPLGKVGPDLSRAIFQKWYGSDIGSDCDPILELLDGLPLALAQAASFLRETAVDAKTYVEIYNRRFDELMGPLDGSKTLQDYDKTTATTWVVSFREIERISTGAANLIRLWAFFDNKELSHDLLAGAKNEPAGWCPDWLSEMASDQLQFLQATRLLRRYSMIETSEEAGNCYSIHPVVHRWMLYLDDPKDNESAKLALILIGEGRPNLETQQDWMLRNKFLPHAERWLRRMRVEPRRTWHASDEASITGLYAIGALFSSRHKDAEAEEVLKWAMGDGEKTLGPDHGLVYWTKHTLKAIYMRKASLNFDEVKDVLQRELLDAEKALGDYHPTTLNALALLGTLHIKYNDESRLKEAERIFKLVLGRSGIALERPNIMGVQATADLGLIYLKQRKFTEAERMYHLAMEEGEKLFVGNNPNRFFTFTRLAAMYQSQGKVDKAIEMYERALHGVQARLPADHPLISRARRNMEGLQHFQDSSNTTKQTVEASVTTEEDIKVMDW